MQSKPSKTLKISFKPIENLVKLGITRYNPVKLDKTLVG